MTTAKNIFNPFPGLRPFSFKDRRYYFGRKDHIREVIEKVSNKRFIAITGSSGSGKSSLINAGILPGITETINNEAVSSIKVIGLRPGISPVDNLARALNEDISNTGVKKNESSQPDKTASLLRSNPDSLTEFLRQTSKESKERIILVIDQFEDLFRFKQSRNNSTIIPECDTFIKLIVETHKQEVLPIYIILAFRSDFIEELQKFQDLNHLIVNNNFILPEMTRDDMQKAICLPADLHGGKMDPELVNKLLNDISDKHDKLPLLQHSLNRIWEQWMRQKKSDLPVLLEDYEAVGGIDNALIRHLDETYEELSDTGRLICERIFKTITEKDKDNREISIPLRIADIAYITGFRIKKIIDIVERFRQPDRSFLFPTPEVKLNSDTIVELTHESLMRLWPRLQNWMSEEAESVIMYKRLAEASKLYQQGQEPLLNASELEQALLWQEKHKPSLEWAQRYNPAYERTMQYIIKSKEEYDYEEMVEREKSERATRYTRIFAVIAILFLAVSGFFIFNISDLLSGAQDQPELSEQREAPVDEQSDIADNLNNGLSDTDQILPDQAVESLTEESLPNRITAEEQVTADEISPDEVPAARDQVIIEPSATPDKEVSPPTTQPEPEEEVSPPATQPEPEEEVISPATQPDPEEERAREETLRRRMVSVSQTLALASRNIEEDPDLKALLALQSHIFNQKYNGASYNPDIYSGLVASVKDLYGSNYNAYKGHTGSVNSVVFRPNSTVFYSASSDGRVMQWDVNDEDRNPTTLIHDQVLYNTLAISPNAQWLAVATDGMGIKVFNPGISSPDPIQVKWGDNRIVALDFYPDNEHILFAGPDNEVIKYNFRNATSYLVAKSDSEVLSLSVSPDGKTIAAGTRSGQVIIFRDDNDSSGQIIHSDQENNVLTVSFNESGTRLAAGSLRGDVRILEVSSGNLLANLGGHSARVVDVKFCPENKFIASASFDGTVHLWNAQNFSARPVVLGDHGSWVQAVAFNTTGDKMVTGSRQESRLLVWATDTNEMASMICEEVTRNLTIEEWNQYVGEDISYMESCTELSGM